MTIEAAMQSLTKEIARLETLRKEHKALLRRALKALEKADRISGHPNNKKIVLALQDRLK